MAEMTEKEKATNAKEELLKLLQRKAKAEEDLRLLENTIYDFEGTYLSGTKDSGNIVQGWARINVKKRQKWKVDPVKDEDRIFSSSSHSSAGAVKSSCPKPIKIEPSPSSLDVSGVNGQEMSHLEAPRPPKLRKRCLPTADKSMNADVKPFDAGN